MPDDRPNLLYIFADQHTHHAMSCAGNRDVHTPNMDALAARGVRFINAYCAYPLCTPSRVSMLSGKMPSQLRCDSNAMTWRDDDREATFGHLLTRAGYACGYAGKWHAGDGGIVLSQETAELFGFEFVSGFDDNALPDACARFFQQERDQPFSLTVSFDNPHNICEHGRDQVLPWGEVEEEDTPQTALPNLPANYPETAHEPQIVRLYKRSSPKTALFPEYSPTRWRRYRNAYFRLVQKVDAQLGQILAALDQAGHADHTVVIYSSDHGEMAGAHQCSHKNVLYRESVGVPLVVADPRVAPEQRGRVSDALVSNGLDLLPTLCDYAGAEAPDGLAGKSWRPMVEGKTDTAHESVLVETMIGSPSHTGSGASSYDGAGRLIRTRDYTYTCYTWGQYREQLFDVRQDPGEMINLAIEARHREALHEHRVLLADQLKRIESTFGEHYGRPGQASVPGIGFFPIQDA